MLLTPYVTGVGSNIGAVGGERSGIKSSSRSRKKGSKKNRHAMSNLDYDDEEDGNEFVDLEIAIPGMRRLSQSMNPLRSNVYSNIPLPSIGSRAAGEHFSAIFVYLHLSRTIFVFSNL